MPVSAVAEVDDRLIAESDRSQNGTVAALLEHGIGPSLYCSIKKSLVVQCLVARPPGPPYRSACVSYCCSHASISLYDGWAAE